MQGIAGAGVLTKSPYSIFLDIHNGTITVFDSHSHHLHEAFWYHWCSSSSVPKDSSTKMLLNM
jgi:hypothetical protein